MRTVDYSPFRAWKTGLPAIIAGLLSLVPFVACGGGGDATTEVKMAAAERPDIDRAATSRGAISLPASEAFNYQSCRSGQSEAGRGESKVLGKDGAVCRAEADQGGSAWSEFQLGYSFDNLVQEPLDAVIKLRLKVAESNVVKGQAPEEDEEPTSAATTLRFFIKDSNGSTLKDNNLLSSSVMTGPKQAGVRQELVFDARFEPDRGYYLIVAGRADVQASDEQSVSVQIEVTEVSLEIDWRPAKAAAIPPPIDEPVAAGDDRSSGEIP